MIEKDEIPIDAVRPTDVQRVFLKRIVKETTEYARSKNHSDMYFQGHSDQTYFGAYSTKIIRRGAGRFVFGFDRRSGKLRMAIPIGISEPYRLAKSWTGDPSRNRAVIEIGNDLSEEMQLYFIEMGKRSIDFHYEGRLRGAAANRTYIER
ncbi:MAG: hypothetical protein HY707_13505 [Ignavibacteriae bacterium]|nr:hypothetical protein [Ignavibacteriota bacterium]